MKPLNNKGYMLVEIILAAALAMGVVYFITELTIKLKNKNDDLLVKTLVYTDQAIIYNKIMEDLYTTTDRIDCDIYIYHHLKINTESNVFEFDGFKNIVSEYATLGTPICNDTGDNSIKLTIPIEVPQLPDEDFDVVINYTKS